MDFAAVADVARRQDGFVTLENCRVLGVPERTVHGWVAAGRLERWHHAVFGVGGLPATFERRLRSALLAAGPPAVVSHRAGAELWGLGHWGVAEISIPYTQRLALDGVVVHRSRDLDREPGHTRQGLAVTGPMRAVIDCGAVLPHWEVRDLLERALADRLFTIASIERTYSRLARPGRRGGGVIRRVLDARALGAEVPDSLLEVRMAALLARAGLPVAAFQHEVLLDGRRSRIDFAYPHLRLAIEVDGWAKFSSPEGAQAMLARQNALVAAGWTVLRFTWADVVRRPGHVARLIRDALHPAFGA